MSLRNMYAIDRVNDRPLMTLQIQRDGTDTMRVTP
jgi:hypothetical protein